MNAARPYNRTLLQGEAFDLNEFVYLTRDIPFNRLNSCLNEHLNEVKRELGQLVNDEFSQFIRLYADIGESGTQEISSLRERLEGLDQSMKVLDAEVRGDIEDVNEIYRKLSSAKREQVLMLKQKEILQDLAALEDLVEKQELGLAVMFYVRVKSLISQIDAPPAFAPASQEALINELELATVRSLKGLDVPAALVLASQYLILEKFKIFELLFVSFVVTPFCERVITQAHLEDLLKSKSSKPGLVALYDAISVFMQETMTTWIAPMAEIVPSGHQLRVGLLLQPILERIMAGLTIIFSPGIPDAFQHAYVASQDFLRQCQDLLGDSREDLSECASWKTFQKSWQINIYYQLRFRDLANLVEDSLDIQLPVLHFSGKVTNVPLEQVYQFKVYRKAVEDLWTDSVLITPLIAKFFKLTIQTSARYIDWLVSIPNEFDGTELGLSTTIVKSCQLYSLREFMDHSFQSALLLRIGTEEPQRHVFRSSLGRFFGTKWQDAKHFLDERVSKSFTLYVGRYYQQQMQKGFASAEVVLSNVVSALQFAGSSLTNSCLEKILSSFASSSQQAFEASQKTATNIHRLKSVMKTQVSAEDAAKLKDHEALKAYLGQEAQILSELAHGHGLDCSNIDALRKALI